MVDILPVVFWNCCNSPNLTNYANLNTKGGRIPHTGTNTNSHVDVQKELINGFETRRWPGPYTIFLTVFRLTTAAKEVAFKIKE